MAWLLSTGMQKAFLGGVPSIIESVNASLSFGDGDGTGSTDTINAASGLDIFTVDDWILVCSGTNINKLVKALTVSATKVEVPAGSFATAGAATNFIARVKSGTLREIMQNSIMHLYDTVRGASADLAEPGTLLAKITRAGGAFAAGVSANGLNIAEFTGTAISRAIDPTTAAAEIWKGPGLVTGTARTAVWYANEYITGASSTALRMYGTVNTSGADVNMAGGTTITTGVDTGVTSVSLTIAGV
jgi:hypothetical protein